MHARVRTRMARATAATLATGALMAAGLVAPADAQPGHGHGHGHGHGNGHGKGHCRAFHALGTGTDNGDGTTTATIYRGSREIGETAGKFKPGDTVDGVLSFTGSIVFTDDKGTLDAPVEGTFDTVSGEFAARSTDVTGTAGYADVTGKLRIRGIQDLSAGTFTEHLHAKLCVPKKKQH